MNEVLAISIMFAAIVIGGSIGLHLFHKIDRCKDWERGTVEWESRWRPFIGCQIKKDGKWVHQDEAFPCRLGPNVTDATIKACWAYRRRRAESNGDEKHG